MTTSSSDTSFFGHPRGLATLFFTEMWERFSYYGTRAILMLFMTAAVTGGGLGFGVPRAGALYGLYASMVYLLSLPGGWLADRFLGQQKAVLWGGIFIAAGNAGLAFPSITTFYLGLAFISIGTGLLKPNVSTIVGQIYKPGDLRRDAGFSIFYMGINAGALISPLICGYFAERVNWHIGFAIASGCMVLGIIQYTLDRDKLGDAGLYPVKPANEAAAAKQRTQLYIGGGLFFGVIALIAALGFSGVVEITPELISKYFGWILLAATIGVFVGLTFFSDFDAAERKRFGAVAFLFLASAVFWSIFEQAGSTLNLFAERYTDLHFMGFAFPASWFQSVNSIFLVILAPVFAWVWLRLGKSDPSSPVKFSMALFFCAMGVFVLIPAAASGGRVSPMWLTATYFLHTIGELCLSPVGLSAMTKLAPARIGGLIMGVWFLSVSIGNYAAGQLSTVFETIPLPRLFALQGFAALGAAVLLILSAGYVKRLIGEAR